MTDNFDQTIAQAPLILTEGAIVERLRRECPVALHPTLVNAALVYDERCRAAMEAVYRQYYDLGREAGLPMLTLTPTWRVNAERLAASEFAGRDVNGDCFRFLDGIRATYGDYAKKIFIGGLMGCRGDAYRPEESLFESDATMFHQAQASALAEAGVDFLIGQTFPALTEAIGACRAMADTGKPYIMSFVVRPGGALLDGISLADAVQIIDEVVRPRPNAFLVNCVYPTVFASAMASCAEKAPDLARRVIGLQANASALSPEELDNAATMHAESPEAFAEAMAQVRDQWGSRVLGGCCGTDQRHIAALIGKLTGGK